MGSRLIDSENGPLDMYVNLSIAEMAIVRDIVEGGIHGDEQHD